MPPLEAWEKVYIKLGSKDSVEELDDHFMMQTCTECHGGNPNELDDYEVAHEGLIDDPASIENRVCGKCHTGIDATYSNSLHQQLWGEKNMIAQRAGVDSFDQCPQSLQDGHAGECARCHASCGDCHISRPDDVGQGFIDSHKFKKKPHQKNQCMACHGSRIAFDYMGDSEAGRDPDAHFAKGWDCMKCHDQYEMHADGRAAGDRYHLAQAPKCEDCHDVADSNEYHQTHWGDLACQVCHVQAYNNCTRCHVDGEWAEDPIYAEQSPTLDFRIGVNHITDRRFDFAVVRHAPIAPSSYDNWGAEGTMTNFNDLPTWKFATPHSIRRWTPRTEVAAGDGCAASCHIGAPNGNPENAKYYLMEDYVQTNWPLEFDANAAVIVDDALPSDWLLELDK